MRLALFKNVLYHVLLITLSFHAFAQTEIFGKVVDHNGKSLAGVNILVKEKIIGTVTDINGDFILRIKQQPPFSLVISYLGFRNQEIRVNKNTSTLNITMEEEVMLGQEVVISASRLEENIMESSVSIEKMDITAVQNTSSDSYYKGIANLKGVDVTTSSINFQIINTRGFGSTGNTRFLQLIDGMDSQAPALNFPIGNLNTPSQLDVESIELIPGASSALYGPSAFNGVLLINSKNPFDYQGLSAMTKMGINHVGSQADDIASPLWEGAIRYARSFFKNKFAVKISASYSGANDWHGTSTNDREKSRTPSSFTFNPGADRLHMMGDEVSINLSILRLSPGFNTLAGSEQFSNGGYFASAYANEGDLPSHVVSLTPYKEQDLINYDARNIKVSTALHYRPSDAIEISYLYNGGFGNSIYTGAQRYALKDFSIQQHRLQVRGDNFYARAYVTLENSGNSYITEFLAYQLYNKAIFERSNYVYKDVTGYLVGYAVEYLRFLNNQNLSPGEINTINNTDRIRTQQAAHNFARNVIDKKYHVDPNSVDFDKYKKQALQGSIPDGPFFNDQTQMYHAEGQYNFKKLIHFMDLQVGANFRLFNLQSRGTIFDDKDNPITIIEYGAYLNANKWLLNRKLKISASLRFDKNQNFEGQFNPRISTLYKISNQHNLRASYQTGFRIPTTQGQYIDLNIISSRLLGGLPSIERKYNLMRTSSTGQNLSFEGASVNQYATTVFNEGSTPAAIGNPTSIRLLQPFVWKPVKPETVQNIEIGYKGVIKNKLLIDASYYLNLYKNFITQVRVRIASENDDGTPNYASLLNGSALTTAVGGGYTGNTAQIYTNFEEGLITQGVALGVTYSLPKGYSINANYNWNVLLSQPRSAQFLTFFNTPEHKINVGIANREVIKNLGFSITSRWQSNFFWESAFTVPANGTVPAYHTLDAQISYKMLSLKSTIRLGGSNLLNQKYLQSLGGPNIGAIYYVSVVFDELFR